MDSYENSRILFVPFYKYNMNVIFLFNKMAPNPFTEFRSLISESWQKNFSEKNPQKYVQKVTFQFKSDFGLYIFQIEKKVWIFKFSKYFHVDYVLPDGEGNRPRWKLVFE